MCKICSQEELKLSLPIFHEKLKNVDLKCLSNFHVKWNCINIDKPSFELGHYILKQMCINVAEGLRLQRGIATDVTKVPDTELMFFPSHNLYCERNLSVAGVFMEMGSKSSNKNFRARCVRDNVTMHHSSLVKRLVQKLQLILNQREEEWDKKQRETKNHHLECLVKKRKNRENYIDRVISKCKRIVRTSTYYR